MNFAESVDSMDTSADELLQKYSVVISVSKWIRIRTVAKFEFVGFPKVIARLVAEYCPEFKLLDWIPRDKLNRNSIYANPNAFRAGFLGTPDLGDISQLQLEELMENSEAIDWIKKYIPVNRIKRFSRFWGNPAGFEFATKIGVTIDFQAMSLNPDSRAIDFLITNGDKISWSNFSTNPGAMPWLREHPEMIDRRSICANPAAIDIIQEMFGDELRTGWLSYNPHPWAIEYLRQHQNKIDWENFSANPGIFEPRADPQLTAILTE